MSLPENHKQQGVQGAITMKSPVELIPEDGKLIVRVTGKNGNYVGIQMGTDFETKDIRTVMNFAEEVYKMGFSDAAQSIMNIPKLEQPMFVGVVCRDTEDFLLWKKENKLIATGRDTRRKFVVGNIMYICITKPEDTHGYTFDDLKLTGLSDLNVDFAEILQHTEPALKLHDRFRAGIKKYGYESQFVREYQSLMQQLRYDERNEFFDKWEV